MNHPPTSNFPSPSPPFLLLFKLPPPLLDRSPCFVTKVHAVVSFTVVLDLLRYVFLPLSPIFFLFSPRIAFPSSPCGFPPHVRHFYVTTPLPEWYSNTPAHPHMFYNTTHVHIPTYTHPHTHPYTPIPLHHYTYAYQMCTHDILYNTYLYPTNKMQI